MSAGGRERPPIVLLSDFGYRDHYAGVMKGVIAAIAPAATVIDLTHGIPAQGVAAGAIVLEQSWRHFPARSIFVAVVDPGVGTRRLPVAVESRAGARFIGPDNGVLQRAVAQAGVGRIVELRSPRYRAREVSATFHGRDIFAPAAAYLWSGTRLTSLGPELPALSMPAETFAPVTEGRNELHGVVVYSDGFGNLITNLDRSRVEEFAGRFRGLQLSVRIGRSAPIEMREAYGAVATGASLAIFGSFEWLEIAVRDGSAAERFAAGPGAPVTIRALRRSRNG